MLFVPKLPSSATGNCCRVVKDSRHSPRRWVMSAFSDAAVSGLRQQHLSNHPDGAAKGDAGQQAPTVASCLQLDFRPEQSRDFGCDRQPKAVASLMILDRGKPLHRWAASAAAGLCDLAGCKAWADVFHFQHNASRKFL